MKKETSEPKKKKKGERPDGRILIKRSRGLPAAACFYGKTRSEAERKYQQAVIAYAQELATAKTKKTTFREMATAYEAYITSPSGPVRRGTVNAYKKHIRPLREFFGDTPMEDIDPQAIRSFMEHMKLLGRSRHSVSNARSVASCIFAYWCAEYHGTGNPALLAKIPAGLKEGGREEPTEQQQALINAHPEGCGFWAWLFEYTGLRMGEANGLKWEDVDLEAGVITPVRAMPWDRNHPYEELLKTEKAYRSVPILSPLRPLLEAGKATHQPGAGSLHRTHPHGEDSRHLAAPRPGGGAACLYAHRHGPSVPAPVRHKPVLCGRAGYGGAAASGPCGYHDHPAGVPASPGKRKSEIYRPAGCLCDRPSGSKINVNEQNFLTTT